MTERKAVTVTVSQTTLILGAAAGILGAAGLVCPVCCAVVVGIFVSFWQAAWAYVADKKQKQREKEHRVASARAC